MEPSPRRNQFADLPDEVVQTILKYVSPSTCLALGKTSRRYRDVSSEPQLWKHYCQTGCRYWGTQHNVRARFRDPNFQDWRRLYFARQSTGVRAHLLLRDVIKDSVGRIDKIDKLVDGGDYDVKDELIRAFEDAPNSPDHLAQKYWAHIALGRLHRSLAVQEWERLKFRDNTPASMELALSSFDMFILHERTYGDTQDIFDQLDSYANQIRNDHPGIDHLSPRNKAILIADYLLQKGWTGISENHHYHSLDHMFLGVSLHSPLRNSMPLISAVIYSSVCRRFNLHGAPCSFPFHVHSVVMPPPGLDLDGNTLSATPSATFLEISDSTHLYMDPFHTPSPVPLDHLDDQLLFIARRRGIPFTPSQRLTLLLPTPPRDLVLRAAYNIFNHPDYSPPPPTFPISEPSAIYAALWSMVLLPSHDLHLRQNLAHLFQLYLEHFTFDLPLLENYVIPLTHGLPDSGHYARLLASIRDADTTPKPPKLRSSPANSEVKYRVGQVFRHRMRNYLAVIVGWDPHCNMAEEWIVMNQVGRLERGRGQPFYNVLVEDTSSRYVAEDNVILLSAEEIRELGDNAGEGDVVGRFPIELGRFFKRFDAEMGLLISNIVDEYPED